MHDETAVALNFAVNRELGKEVENHLFYDMGAGSTVASIVSFSTIKKGKTSSPQLEVKSVGYDRTLGGHELDVRLQNLIADGFMKLNADRVKNDIRMADGAMTRLLKEANRVKQILSANTETMASVSHDILLQMLFFFLGIFTPLVSQVENLHEGLDFKMKVTRAELESICSDLIARVQNPMKKALEAASMTVVS